MHIESLGEVLLPQVWLGHRTTDHAEEQGSGCCLPRPSHQVHPDLGIKKGHRSAE